MRRIKINDFQVAVWRISDGGTAGTGPISLSAILHPGNLKNIFTGIRKLGPSWFAFPEAPNHNTRNVI
jgi:hypothetical protein